MYALSSPPVCKCSRSEQNTMWRWMFILLEGLALHLTLSSKAGWRIICCIVHINLCLCVEFVCILCEIFASLFVGTHHNTSMYIFNATLQCCFNRCAQKWSYSLFLKLEKLTVVTLYSTSYLLCQKVTRSPLDSNPVSVWSSKYSIARGLVWMTSLLYITGMWQPVY